MEGRASSAGGSGAAGEQERLPMAALLAMAMTGFIAILNETLPAGLLPKIAGSLNVSESLAGQLVTLYAVGTVVAAIPVIALTQGWRRKPAFLVAIGGLFVFNTITALSTNYAVTLVARFIAGVAAGMAWSILGGYARWLVVDRLKGRALAIAMVGTPIALSIGVPAGSFLGLAIGWRAAFLAMSGLTVVLIIWVLRAVPDFPGQAKGERSSVRTIFMTPGIRPILVTIFAWMAAHNILYTYLAPFAVYAGFGGSVGVLLFGFGVAALAGIWLTGVLVDRILRVLVLTSLAAFGASAVLMGVLGHVPVATAIGVIVWGLTFGGAATQLQTAAADAVSGGTELVTAMIATFWNTAIALGGIIGGALLGHFGATSLPWATVPLILVAFLVALSARRHGFTPGPRAAHA